MKLLVILTLCLLGLVAYSNSLFNSFHFDDFPSIVNNVSIRSLDHLHDLWHIEPTRFLTFFSFALSYHFDGLHVLGYHVFNLILHIATTILIWIFIFLTLNRPILSTKIPLATAPWIAFFIAAIFLIHPLQTQALNYIYQRSILLAAFFYMASLVLFIKANLIWEDKSESINGKLYYGVSLFCAVLSLFSKENAISLPFILWVYQSYFFKKNKNSQWQQLIPFFLTLLIVPLSWGVLNLQSFIGIHKTVENLAQGLTVREYALTQPLVILTYLKLLAFPLHQRVDYDYTAVTTFMNWPLLASLSLLILILAMAIILKDKFRLLSFGIIWFFLTLMPESSFWPNKDLIFEHRLYLPLLGFSIFLVTGVFYSCQEKRILLSIRILILLVIGFACLTYQRNKIWKNELTLWDDAIHQSPKDSRAYLNRGAAYHKMGDLDHALEDYNMVIGLGIIDPVTLSNRGLIFEKKGEFDLALANFNLAISINPNYAGTYINRGILYRLEGKYDLAIADFSKALEFLPVDAGLHQQRAVCYFLNKEYDKAREDLKKVSGE